jgi:NADPH:quinone reductase-like Zn-dependent oxidoreductase
VRLVPTSTSSATRNPAVRDGPPYLLCGRPPNRMTSGANQSLIPVLPAYALARYPDNLSPDPERQGRAKKFIIDKLTDGTFKPVIAKIFKLDEIVQAHRYMESNEQIGKIVVTV